MLPLYPARIEDLERRSRPGQLCRLPSRRAADIGLPVAARPQRAGQGSRSQIVGAVPRMRAVISVKWGR